MIFATILPNAVARKPRLWLSIIGSLLFLVLLAFLGLGRWLDKEDPAAKKQPPSPFSAAACLPVRSKAGAALQPGLCAANLAFRIPSKPGAAPRKVFPFPYAGEEFYDRLLLLHQGRPRQAPSTFSRPPIANNCR